MPSVTHWVSVFLLLLAVSLSACQTTFRAVDDQSLVPDARSSDHVRGVRVFGPRDR